MDNSDEGINHLSLKYQSCYGGYRDKVPFHPDFFTFRNILEQLNILERTKEIIIFLPIGLEELCSVFPGVFANAR